MFQGQSIRVDLNGAGIAELCFDRRDEAINKLDMDPRASQLLAGIQPRGTRSFADQELLERLMFPQIIEAMHCLEEGIAESAAEFDMSLVLGLGFPRYAGGPLKYAQCLGMDHVVRRCEAYASLGAPVCAHPGDAAAAAAGVGPYNWTPHR